MKKIAYLFLIIFSLFVIGVYLLIPANIEFSTMAVIPTSENGTSRFVLDSTKWENWWPMDSSNYISGKKISARFEFNHNRFVLQEKQYKSATILISHKENSYSSQLILIPFQKDSTIIQWKSKIKGGLNPITRIKEYQAALQMKTSMTDVLQGLRLFLSKTENVYGIPIERTGTPDTIIVSTKSILSEKPGTVQIYSMIEELKKYAESKGAIQTGLPIYNISLLKKGQHQLMCALPIDRELISTDRFTIRQMVKGAFMKTEVLGGEYRIENAKTNMQQYFEDFQKVAMAIPFIMPVTNRMYETDSTKWITRLYYPVF